MFSIRKPAASELTCHPTSRGIGGRVTDISSVQRAPRSQKERASSFRAESVSVRARLYRHNEELQALTTPITTLALSVDSRSATRKAPLCAEHARCPRGGERGSSTEFPRSFGCPPGPLPGVVLAHAGWARVDPARRAGLAFSRRRYAAFARAPTHTRCAACYRADQSPPPESGPRRAH